jgi:hypothetical protein
VIIAASRSVQSGALGFLPVGSRAQDGEVHLGVDGGGGQISMPQHLAHLDDCRSPAEHLRRQRVPHCGGPDAGQPGTVAGPVGG